jgi:hypothetical protein
VAGCSRSALKSISEHEGHEDLLDHEDHEEHEEPLETPCSSRLRGSCLTNGGAWW